MMTIDVKKSNNHYTKDLVLFDVDGTLFRGRTQKVFLTILKHKNFISYRNYVLIMFQSLLYQFGILDFKKVMTNAYKHLSGHKVDEIQKTIENQFGKFKCRIYREAYHIIRYHKERNDYLVLISTSVEPVIKEFAREFEVDAYACTKLEHRNQIYTGNIDGSVFDNQLKISWFNEFIKGKGVKYKMIHYYNDHISEATLMELVDHPVCVNPDRKLKKKAQENNWEIRRLV